MKRQGSVVGGIPAGRGDLEEKDQIIANAIQVPAQRSSSYSYICLLLFSLLSLVPFGTPVLPFGAGVDRSCGGRKWDERFPHAGGAGVAARKR